MYDIRSRYRENTKIRKSERGKAGVNRCPSVKSKAEQTVLHKTKLYCHKTGYTKTRAQFVSELWDIVAKRP